MGVSGDPSTTVSTLRTLNPIRRALVGIPFLYQRITSTTPIGLLIAPKASGTTLSLLQLDGTTDWKLAQRKALVAWTGSSLNVTPSLSTSLSVVHWGSSDVTGRGLLCVAGAGHVFSIELADGESYVAHPANVLAYTTSGTSNTKATPLPQPYRFRSSPPRFQIPLDLGNWFPDTRLQKAVKDSGIYKFFAAVSLRVKTWSRRTIFGDRLFLRFEGPTTILVQSRANRVNEVLTSEQITEIADAPVGQMMQTIRRERIRQDEPPQVPRPVMPVKSTIGSGSSGTNNAMNVQPSAGFVSGTASRGLGPMGEKSSPTMTTAAGGKSLSSKSDAERMGVQGAQVSSQTNQTAERKAPQLVAAERPSVTTAGGAVHAEAESFRRQVSGQEQPATEKEVKIGSVAQKGPDHV